MTMLSRSSQVALVKCPLYSRILNPSYLLFHKFVQTRKLFVVVELKLMQEMEEKMLIM